MRRTSARLRLASKGLERKASEEPRVDTRERKIRRTTSEEKYIQLSPQDMGDVVAGEAARRQRYPDGEEPYQDFHYYLQRAKLLSIATVDPDRIHGRPQTVGRAWQSWIPIKTIDQYVDQPHFVVAMSPSDMGYEYGFIYVARHNKDGVLWPIPRIPGQVQGTTWGWKRQDAAKRFPVSDGGRRRSSLVCPSSIEARKALAGQQSRR